jgi:transcriptional regulator
VPTWNYAVVHVYGVARIEEDPEVVRGMVAAMAAQYEAGRERPWGMEQMPGEMQDAMLRAIVGFSVAITRIETKFKLGANRSAEDQEGMIRALGASGFAGDRELGELMERERDERERGC